MVLKIAIAKIYYDLLHSSEVVLLILLKDALKQSIKYQAWLLKALFPENTAITGILGCCFNGQIWQSSAARIKSVVHVCLIGNATKEILKDVGIVVGTKITTKRTLLIFRAN